MVKWKIEKPSCEVHKQYYILNGHKYSRVTSVLGVIAKHGLAIWYSKVGERKAKRDTRNSSDNWHKNPSYI